MGDVAVTEKTYRHTSGFMVKTDNPWWTDSAFDPFPGPEEWLAWVVIAAVFAAVVYLCFFR